MTGAAEMRRVMAHASAQLVTAIKIERAQTYPRAGILIAASYAQGVLDLLGTYLTDTESAAATLHLLDDHGVLWRRDPDADTDTWTTGVRESVGDAPLTRDELSDEWGPLREVWVR